MPLFRFLTPFWIVLQAVTAQTCYFPAGNAAEGHTACNSSLEVSTCCGQDETCLSNGLCLQSGFLSRGSCTDSSWGTQCCPYCRENFNGGGAGLWTCGNGLFSCGTETEDECETANFTIADYHIVLRDFEFQSAISAANTEVASSDATSCSDPTGDSAPAVVTGGSTTQCGSWSASDRTAQLLGIGLGAVLPLVIALAITCFLLWREKRDSKAKTKWMETTAPAAPSEKALDGLYGPGARSHQRFQELEEEPGRGIHIQPRTHELPNE